MLSPLHTALIARPWISKGLRPKGAMLQSRAAKSNDGALMQPACRAPEAPGDKRLRLVLLLCAAGNTLCSDVLGTNLIAPRLGSRVLSRPYTGTDRALKL